MNGARMLIHEKRSAELEPEEIFSLAETDPYGCAKAYQAETGRPVVGYSCSYAPVEIIHAAGALPFRIPVRSGSGSNASERHLQPYCCSFAKGLLDDAMCGRLDFLDAMVFPHTCDTMQRLSDIWRVNGLPGKHFDIDLPAVVNTPEARSYAERIFRTFAHALFGYVGREYEINRLRESVELYNRVKDALRSIVQGRNDGEIAASGPEIAAIMKASSMMAPDVFLNHLDIWTHRRRQPSYERRKPQAKPVLLSGSQCAFPELYQIIEDAGAFVVADDSCTGMRNTGGAVDMAEEMVPAITRWYLDRVPCPAKHRGLADRGEHLIQLTQEHGASGVIFVHLKFCDPHGFDYPDIKSRLDQMGIASLRVEIDEGMIGEGQIQTRIQAFMETLASSEDRG